MFRINLLPKEVLERRRYEGWYVWVGIAAVGLIAIVLAVYGLLFFLVAGKTSDLQGIEEQQQQYSTSAGQLSVFQSKEDELKKRETVALTALAGRVDVGQVANDVSLVLPDEVWLDLLTISESSGISIQANTPRTSGQSNDVAYKSVAKTLVRLNDLPELYDVWLAVATNAQWTDWPASGSSQSSALPLNVVTFQATGKVVIPTAGSASGSTGGSSATSGTASPAAAASAAVQSANSGSSTASAP